MFGLKRVLIYVYSLNLGFSQSSITIEITHKRKLKEHSFTLEISNLLRSIVIIFCDQQNHCTVNEKKVMEIMLAVKNILLLQ